MYNLYNKGIISLGKMRPAKIQNQKKKKRRRRSYSSKKAQGEREN
jgi:hypothetical protein